MFVFLLNIHQQETLKLGKKMILTLAKQTCSPISAAKFGATVCIRETRYSARVLRYSASAITRDANNSIFIKSTGEISIPIGKKEKGEN